MFEFLLGYASVVLALKMESSGINGNISLHSWHQYEAISFFKELKLSKLNPAGQWVPHYVEVDD